MNQDAKRIKDEAYEAAQRGDLKKAVELFEKASVMLPDDAELYYNLGVAYGELALEDVAREELWEDKTDEEDFFENAIKNYLKSTELNPDNTHAWNNLGILYKALDWDDKAAEAFERSLKIDPGQKDIMELLNELR
ncbi:MAG TPA: tetratricopeptide repeat protein [Candidatus Mcinerneyibacteriales bacterium]|nr:tetratricopeptide repeat protein [Candidatus Mcinerneyibacteriota bacterium]HOO60455.1 tetratricopeptide repeat protein [Candidatus Mcinerneyibacteriales bacterium]HPE20750.1 tetratricopeptide repeat protein [Candidatus Mcinerneyibacteriales bacterium]HPJ70385.1 tetratricopeptide repeat protein [Candidatus Mcinerneyibacteriales bacterium]HPQ89320.1 tetratricopeptide repeat protein [Candidatus Mcinerneyibacteriales bacterium]